MSTPGSISTLRPRLTGRSCIAALVCATAGLFATPLARPARADESGQQKGRDQLRRISQQRPEIRFRDGEVISLSARVPVSAVGGSADPVDAATAYLTTFKDLYQLNPASLFVDRLVNDQLGAHVFFGQRRGEASVFGAQLVVHVGKDAILGSAGRYLADAPAWAGPAIAEPAALATALKLLGLRDGRELGSARKITFNPALIFRDDELQVRELTKRNYPAYLVTVTGTRREGGAAAVTFILDASDGRTLLSLDRSEQILGSPRIAVASGGTQFICGFIGGQLWFTEAGVVPGASPDSEGTTAFNASGSFYNLLSSKFFRDSYDNRGATLNSHLDMTPVSVSKSNAAWQWWCNHAVFDNNMATTDVVAHEFTHALTGNTSNLVYSGESGALNESYSDVFAAFVDRNNWTMGEGSALGTIRDLSNPPAFFQPDRMSKFVVTTADSGGVHTNSGITNKAAFLIVAGGSFNGITVTGLGFAKANQLYHQTLTAMLASNATMQVAADTTILTANLFVTLGLHGFTAKDACQVNNAFAAVELGKNDLDCDGIPDVLDPDDDGDGIADGVDNCRFIYNPGQSNIDHDTQGDACDSDMDGDFILNTADNCPMVPNQNQQNTGGSALGDACEDRDGDGVLDLTDNCKAVANSDQKDIDGDKIGDFCDNDLDNDGVPNNQDNCIAFPSSNQNDADGDGMGDVCDLCPNTPGGVDDLDKDGIGDECDADVDGDLVPNAQDNCPRVANAIQLDSNHNGIGDACDPDGLKGAGPVTAEMVLRGKQQYFERFRTDLNPCINFPCPTRPSGPWQTRFDLEFSTPLYAQIVDAEGQVVAFGGPSTQVSLAFEPKVPFSYSRKGGDGDSGLGKKYFLETYTTRESVLAPEYRMVMRGQSGLVGESRLPPRLDLRR